MTAPSGTTVSLARAKPLPAAVLELVRALAKQMKRAATGDLAKESVGVWELYDLLVRSQDPVLRAHIDKEINEFGYFAVMHGYKIRAEDLCECPPGLARLVAEHALRRKNAWNSLNYDNLHPADRNLFHLFQHHAPHFEAPLDASRVVLYRDTYSREWFCAHVADLLRYHVWRDNHGSVLDFLEAAKPEAERLCALRDMGEPPSEPAGSHAETVRRAQVRALLAGYARYDGRRDVAASRAALPSPLQLVVSEAIAARSAHGSDALGADPMETSRMVETLDDEGLVELEIAGARLVARGMTPAPVTKAAVDWLQQQGYLRNDTFAGLVFGSHTHATPSAALLTSQLKRFGLRYFEVAVAKGQSTNPLVTLALKRSAQHVTSGFGRSDAAPKEQEKATAYEFGRVLAAAQAAGLPWLFFNDGMNGMQAFTDAFETFMREHGAAPDGWVVENTQSGANFAQTAGGAARLPYGFTVHAEHWLKKAIDRATIGPSSVAQAIDFERRPMSVLKVVVIGGGAINQGVVADLWRRGVRSFTVIDPKPREELLAGFRQANPDIDLAALEFRAPAPDGAIPPADWVFVATGQEGVFGRAALFSPQVDPSEWRVVVNTGSATDIDPQMLEAIANNQLPDAYCLGAGPRVLTERGWLVVDYTYDGKPQRTRILQRGLPIFGGGRDRSPLYADVICAIRLVHLCLAADVLKGRIKGIAEPAADSQALIDSALDHIGEIACATYPELAPLHGGPTPAARLLPPREASSTGVAAPTRWRRQRHRDPPPPPRSTGGTG
jgi:hypothetical protein